MSRQWISVNRREALRTNLWLMPAVLVVAGGVLFVLTYLVDRAAYNGSVSLPGWIDNGGADAGRQILTAIAAAVIIIVGLVFSIVIVALTLASTQFGPRMLRSFIRDWGTQVTLGVFVATFVYCVLALGSIAPGSRGDFVPHLSISVSLAAIIVDSCVLIFFIHHVAKSIQLPQVIGGIAEDLRKAIDVQIPLDRPESPDDETEIAALTSAAGGPVLATTSGYLQHIEHARLVRLAVSLDVVIELLYRPGHFVGRGLPWATVWPAEAAEAVSRELERAHFTGPHRTLAQDLTFAIDQLVEIAIRALSGAVNDTFTAMTCIDWLGDGLSDISTRPAPRRVHHDDAGNVRLIESKVSYARLVERSFDKVRQAGRGMPAIMIRQLESLARIMQFARTPQRRAVLQAEADAILVSSEEAISDPGDLQDVRRRYDRVLIARDARQPMGDQEADT